MAKLTALSAMARSCQAATNRSVHRDQGAIGTA
jgi:hypothetical protein